MSQVSISQFVEAHFRPACEQLEGAGATHVAVVVVPAAGIFRIYSGLPPGQRADLIDKIADKLRETATQLRAQAVAPSILVPGNERLS